MSLPGNAIALLFQSLGGRGSEQVVSDIVAIGNIRSVGLFMGGAAALAMVVVGCTNIVQGDSAVDTVAAPQYRTSVSLSSSASRSLSVSRESSRQSSITAAAVTNACQTLKTGVNDEASAVADYVQAFNKDLPIAQYQAAGRTAIETIDRATGQVSAAVSNILTPSLQSAMTGWVDAARALKQPIADDAPPAVFNAVFGRLKDARKAARDACP